MPPPRKKPKSKSNHPTQNSSQQRKQPPPPPPPQRSKFGIQHFFQRHSENARSSSSSSLAPPNPTPPTSTAVISPVSAPPPPPTTTAAPNPNNIDKTSGSELGNPITIDIDVAEESPQRPPKVSPQLSKSVSGDRFKFSPGMLIKQSQDDGVEEVTWKISPVNERLMAVSKQMPDVVKALADSSKLNSFTINHCSFNNASLGTANKVGKWLSSSPRQKAAAERPLIAASKVGLKRVNPFQDAAINERLTDGSGSITSQQSPFRTPPSLSYCHDRLVNAVECNGVSDHLGLRQHKKALLELLDQVEDAISVDGSLSSDTNSYSPKTQDTNDNEPVRGGGPLKKLVATGPPEMAAESSSNCSFLVLEVSEKHRPIGSSGAQHPCKVLRLLNEQSGEEKAVYLSEEWFCSVIAPGDAVNVVGDFDDQGKCNVDHDNNLLIVHPDVLISGTRVAASFSCSRRSVLDERLRCGDYSTPALIGTLLHQIFQAGLMEKNPTTNFLELYARMVLQKNIESLYACGVNENDMLKTLVEAIPKILNWIFLFKNSEDTEASVDFGSDNGLKKIRIAEVMDIEEMAWAPKYGLKGMIDASVRVKEESSRNGACEKILPLEFKTGKLPNGQSSMEHCAQVILYTLLMSERYTKHIDSGLLYYLQSDQTQGISVRRSDVVGLIMRRNELANDLLKASTMQQLPPMLRSPSMCSGCRHLDVCTIYHKVHGGNTDSSGLGNLFDSHVHHLTPAHHVFLRHWDWLIDLEAKEMQLAKKEIWHSRNLRSDHPSGCISSVVLDTSDELPYHKDNRFIYCFVRQKLPSHSAPASTGDILSALSSQSNGLDHTLKIGDYVMLSTESGLQTVASGVVTDISQFHVSISFSKRLRIPGCNSSSEANDLLQTVWRINKDDAMTSFSVMRSNLVQLFLQLTQSSNLRKMIVDLEAPRFDSGGIFSQDPAISYIWSVQSLNGDQRRAILKILTAKDYALILGMPGTGKTTTMVHAVKALLIRGASILLTSYTNSAVDTLLIKLKAQLLSTLASLCWMCTNCKPCWTEGLLTSGASIFYVLEDMKLSMKMFGPIAFQQ